MEPATLVTTAITLASPYLAKTGEVLAEKVGENMWNFIKKPFENKKARPASKVIESEDMEEVKSSLLVKINEDERYKAELLNLINDAQRELRNGNQNIHNSGAIEKQIIITNNSGSIQM